MSLLKWAAKHFEIKKKLNDKKRSRIVCSFCLITINFACSCSKRNEVAESVWKFIGRRQCRFQQNIDKIDSSEN